MDDTHAFPTGIALPEAFSPTSPDSLRAYVRACIDLLTSPLASSLLECHPNDVAVHGPNSEWQHWWRWAARRSTQWTSLVPNWPPQESGPPPDVTNMLRAIDSLVLPRSKSAPSSAFPPPRGMSPKKSHEVSEMSASIQSLFSKRCNVRHAVDVGAGQGYLSRALSEPPHSMDVLALDFSEIQTIGAERRGRNIKLKSVKTGMKRAAKDTGLLRPSKDTTVVGAPTNSTTTREGAGSVTHETIHVDPQSLNDSVTKWIASQSGSTHDAVPVLLVALHACGSLTPDLMRSYVACRLQTSLSTSPSRSWYPAGLIAVGCCYNLMSPEHDFPMSTTVSKEANNSSRQIRLSYNHRSLAAQSPSQWSLNTSTRSAAMLAIRKIVYRALLGKQMALMNRDPMDKPERHGKVGRLHDSVYASLETFITDYNTKNNVETPIPEWKDVENLASCLAVLHVLRCRIGPVVEGLILLDRWLYLAEHSPDDEVLSFNIFDQDKGSGRNVALVARPR